MIRSMTGFGSASGQLAGRSITVEVKSVNNRFREVVVRAPKVCAPLEDSVKKLVAGQVERGRIDLWVQLDDKELRRKSLAIDVELAEEVNKLLLDLQARLNLNEPVTMSQLLSFNVIHMEEESPNLEELWVSLSPVVEEAVAALVVMRESEGLALFAELEKRLRFLQQCNQEMEKILSGLPMAFMEKLKERMTELAEGFTIDPTRMAQEAAFLADRADITEEVVRFNSHLERFEAILADGEASGRRLDFLLQEMGREVNTMGSKSQDIQATGLVLDMKAELEKLREQVQNVE